MRAREEEEGEKDFFWFGSEGFFSTVPPLPAQRGGPDGAFRLSKSTTARSRLRTLHADISRVFGCATPRKRAAEQGTTVSPPLGGN